MVICTINDTNFVWKWYPAWFGLGKYKRKNMIRWGSFLHVMDGQTAVLVCRHKDEICYESFEGPDIVCIEREALPTISNFVDRVYGAGRSRFPAEVYFVNFAGLVQCKFDVPYFYVLEPGCLSSGLPVTAKGTFNFRIPDYWEFIRVNGFDGLRMLRRLTVEEFYMGLRNLVGTFVKELIETAPGDYHVCVPEIEAKIPQINEKVMTELGGWIQENMGVSLSAVDIKSIRVKKSSSEYRRYKRMQERDTEKEFTLSQVH